MVLAVGDLAPNFEALDQHGKLFSLEKFEAPVILYVAGNQMYSSEIELYLRKVNEAYEEHKIKGVDFAFVTEDYGMNVDPQENVNIVRKLGVKFPVLCDSENLARLVALYNSPFIAFSIWVIFNMKVYLFSRYSTYDENFNYKPEIGEAWYGNTLKDAFELANSFVKA